ncbi:MAG: hypothetical protein ACM3JI_05320 [Anaerolineae bacterium]
MSFQVENYHATITNKLYGACLSMMEDQLTQHAAWHGNMSQEEVSKELQGREPFTFAFTMSKDSQTYHLNYVNKDNQVKDFFFVKNEKAKSWEHLNGASWQFVSLDNLLVQIMGCEIDQATPLDPKKPYY